MNGANLLPSPVHGASLTRPTLQRGATLRQAATYNACDHSAGVAPALFDSDPGGFLMLLRRILLLVVGAWLWLGSRADAHFLFIRVLPAAEGGRAAEVYFSELAEAGDPRYVAKIAGSQLWLSTTPGQFEPLTVHKANDRLRAWVPGSAP